MWFVTYDLADDRGQSTDVVPDVFELLEEPFPRTAESAHSGASHGDGTGSTYFVATTTRSLVQTAVMVCIATRRKEPRTASTSSSVFPKNGKGVVRSTFPLHTTSSTMECRP